MSKRKATPKKTRFEVFKRDAFTCQYCGRKAPDVVLQVDHISPVSKGGANEILNYITSCVECNLGKGARELSDDSALAKQRGQLEELNERREQIEMMIEWRDGLRDLDSMKADEVARACQLRMPGSTLNERGMDSVRSWIRDFPLDIILDAIDVASEKLVTGSDGKATHESAEAYLSYIPRVAKCKLLDRKEPGLGDLLRLRGYLRTFMYFRDWECLDLLRACRDAGVSADEMRALSRRYRKWIDYEVALRELAGI